jgi:hypothetical protein
MSKERKVRNFDFLKQTPSELPSRAEVIQKTAELTGQLPVGEEKPPSVSPPIAVVSAPVAAVTEAIAPAKKIEKEKKTVKKRQKIAEPPPVVQTIVEKSKVGRRALVDTRKPFTTTITLNNKRQLRQLCAEHDIAMSDVINEILAAHFEQRTPNF